MCPFSLLYANRLEHNRVDPKTEALNVLAMGFCVSNAHRLYHTGASQSINTSAEAVAHFLDRPRQFSALHSRQVNCRVPICTL